MTLLFSVGVGVLGSMVSSDVGELGVSGSLFGLCCFPLPWLLFSKLTFLLALLKFILFSSDHVYDPIKFHEEDIDHFFVLSLRHSDYSVSDL